MAKASPSLRDLDRNDVRGAVAVFKAAKAGGAGEAALADLTHALFMLQDDAADLHVAFERLAKKA